MLACRQILARCWQELQPVREVLSLPAEQLVHYGQRERFVARCRVLDLKEIACLADKQDILAAFADCLPGQRLGPDEALPPPSLVPLLSYGKGKGYSSRRSRRLLARLAGNWSNRFNPGRLSIDWKILANGEVQETWHGPSGSSYSRHFRIGLEGRHRLFVESAEGQRQLWPFVRLGKNKLLTAPGEFGGVFDSDGRGRFLVPDGGDIIVVGRNRCRLATPRGRLLDCRIKRRGRILDVRWRGGPAGAERRYRRQFLFLGRVLVDRRLYRVGLFVRR